MPPKRTRAKRSIVWTYYTAVDDDSRSAKCNICEERISHCGNTTNMWSHLRTKHSTILESDSSADESDLVKKRREISVVTEVVAGTSSAQPSHGLTRHKNHRKSVSQTKQKYPADSKRAKEINEALLEMIAVDVRPFNIVEGRGFRKFVNALNNKYEIPTRKHLAEKQLEDKYMKTCLDIKKQLQEAAYVHLTTDLWSNTHRQMSYIGVTAHCIISNKLFHAVLNVEYFPQQHTADNLKEALLNTANTWEILSKISFAVTDNGANIVAAVNRIPWEHLSCFAHNLDLIAKAALKTEQISEIISKCRSIVHIFKSSNLASEALRNQQIVEGVRNPLGLRKDVQTRWNSIYLMIDRILELRNILPPVLIHLKRNNTPVLTFEDLELLQCIRNILKPLFLATKEMSGEGYVTASKVIPIVHCLESCIEKVTDVSPDVSELRDNLMTEIKKRFEQLEINPTYSISTILDPRYKSVPFQSANCLKMAKHKILEYCQGGENSDSESAPSENDTITEIDDLWASFDRKVKDSKADKISVSSAKVELKRYLKSPLLNRRSDPLVWWSTGWNQFLKLKELAMKYLSVPATSVPCERVFSKAGEMLSAKRAMLQPKHIKMLSIIGMNYENEK